MPLTLRRREGKVIMLFGILINSNACGHLESYGVIVMIKTIVLLLISNIFMTIAWYGHLKNMNSKPLWFVILISWGIAFFEYCFQVPGNRIGNQFFSLPQLKVIQEVITMTVFSVFCISYMKVALTKNFLYASLCLVMAVFFIFRDLPQGH